MAKTFIVETSARHVHLSEADFKVLFGENATLTKKKDLSQPGQYACEERVTVKGTKEVIKVNINNDDLSSDDKEMIEDMLVVALNDAFKQKRKNLRNNLKGYDLDIISKVLFEYGFDLTNRAEDLGYEVFVDIVNSL